VEEDTVGTPVTASSVWGTRPTGDSVKRINGEWRLPHMVETARLMTESMGFLGVAELRTMKRWFGAWGQVFYQTLDAVMTKGWLDGEADRYGSTMITNEAFRPANRVRARFRLGRDAKKWTAGPQDDAAMLVFIDVGRIFMARPSSWMRDEASWNIAWENVWILNRGRQPRWRAVIGGSTAAWWLRTRWGSERPGQITIHEDAVSVYMNETETPWGVTCRAMGGLIMSPSDATKILTDMKAAWLHKGEWQSYRPPTHPLR
jgi:hypothetical protein